MDLSTIERLSHEWEVLVAQADAESEKYYARIQAAGVNFEAREAAIADRSAMDAACAAAKAKRVEGSAAMRTRYDEIAADPMRRVTNQ